MREIYNDAEGNPSKEVDPSIAANRLGIDKDTLMGDIKYLVDKRLLEEHQTFGSPLYVSITAGGIDYVEGKIGV